MASFLTQAEPYEESQGDSSVNASASPDALKAFYSEMERRETAQRKLSRGKASSGKSIWARKKAPAGASTIPSSEKALSLMDSVPRNDGEDMQMEQVEEQKENYDQFSMLTRSIIPDPLGELPAWFGKESDWPPSSAHSHRSRYPIHNPVGPRWYKNHHLIPPSQMLSNGRPLSVFSPSFPPMAPPTPDITEDPTRLPGPSRTPSGSPLPTPDSSQSRLVDPGSKVRTRKNSQTAHDTVDLLDVTDPWGTNWHHQSPYDAGLASNPVSVDAPETQSNVPRSRLSSMTTTGRRKTVTPSPLSQSTSALHLQPPGLAEGHLPRKLSKRRKPVLGGLFGPKSSDAASAPVTPIEDSSADHSASQHDDLQSQLRRSTLPSRSTVVPPNPSSSVPLHMKGDKKEKRGSVLGRLTKKFSLMRRNTYDAGGGQNGDDWHHVEAVESKEHNSRFSASIQRQPSPEKPALGSRQSSDPTKRIPPPPLEHEVVNTQDAEVLKKNTTLMHDAGDRDSSVSIEAPFSIGRLTIANPDADSSGRTSPVRMNALVPSRTIAESMNETVVEEPANLMDASEPSLPPLPDSVTEPDGPFTSIPQESSEEPAISLPVTDMHPQSPVLHAENAPPPVPAPLFTTFQSPTLSTSLPPVPFPTAEEAISSTIPTSDVARLSTSISMSAEDSPISRASILVNPPTPYLSAVPMPTVIPPEVSIPREEVPYREERRVVREPSPTKVKADVQTRDGGQYVKPIHVSPSRSRPRDEKRPSREASPTKIKPDNLVKSDSQRVKTAPVLPSVSTPRDGTTMAPRDEKRIARDTSPTKIQIDIQVKDDSQRIRSPSAVVSRETETFRLVRSPSEGVHNSGTTITAGGEQWEIVESEPPRRSKTKESSRTKDRDSESRNSGSRREQRRLEKVRAQAETDQRRAQSQGRQTSVDERAAEPPTTTGSISSRATRARSLDVPHRPGAIHPIIIDVNKPQPPAPEPTSGSSSLERRPSASARPTSELPSTAELNAMRAREAWEMDRLWKGRSMHNGPHPNGDMSGPPAADDTVMPARAANDEDGGAVYGSSHTAFMVQTPFQGQPTNLGTSDVIYYPQTGSHPPPGAYLSTPSLERSFYPSSGSRDNSNIHRSPSSSYPSTNRLSNPTSNRPPLSNPLPEPPRESTYEPAPFPALSDSNNGRPWTNYTSVTAAH